MKSTLCTFVTKEKSLTLLEMVVIIESVFFRIVHGVAVGGEIVATLLSQIAQNRNLKRGWRESLNDSGAEVVRNIMKALSGNVLSPFRRQRRSREVGLNPMYIFATQNMLRHQVLPPVAFEMSH